MVVSPLTRCLQTYQAAVQPVLPSSEVPVLAHPLAAERVYTISEIGRPSVRELQRDFADVDFGLLLRGRQASLDDDADDDDDHNHDPWWYDPTVATKFNRDIPWEEWRPHGEQQQYGTPGEPKKVFQRRMQALEEWLVRRPEKHILLAAHWGVFRHFTGEEMDNCEVCRIELFHDDDR